MLVRVDECLSCHSTMHPQMEGDVEVWVCANCGRREPVIGSHERDAE